MGLADGETRSRGQSPLDAIVVEIKKLEPAGSSNDFVAFVLVREVPRELAGR